MTNASNRESFFMVSSPFIFAAYSEALSTMHYSRKCFSLPTKIEHIQGKNNCLNTCIVNIRHEGLENPVMCWIFLYFML